MFDFLFESCALGQILTRMKLDFLGRPIQTSQKLVMSAFKVMLLLSVLRIVLRSAYFFIIEVFGDAAHASANDAEENQVDEVEWTNVVETIVGWIEILILMFLLFVTIRARQYIRNKYNIPEHTCKGCEDCCCSFWCAPCTICQMGRHTADYSHYQATLCTENGLVAGAPEVV